MDMHPAAGARMRFALTVLVSAILGTASVPLHAEPAPPFLVLLRQAEDRTPRLAESDAFIRAAEGQSVQAATRPNPSVSLEAEDLFGNGPFHGLSRSQTTLGVSEAFELGGKRPARMAAAGATLAATRVQREQVRIDFAYELALAYVAAELTEKRVSLVTEALERARADEQAARALVNAGREAELRSVQANAATTAAQADLESARADWAEALVRLSALAGAAPSYSGVSQSLLDLANRLPQPPAQAAQASPAVLSAEALRNALAQRVSVERTRATPDITLSFGVRRLSGDSANAMVAGVAVPLPFFNNNSGAIAAATAELAAAEARVAAARMNTEAEYRAASLQALAAERRLGAAVQAQEAANEAYRLGRIGYDAGRSPLVELLSARRGLTEAQTRTLDARAARLRAEAALARQMGRVPFGENP